MALNTRKILITLLILVTILLSGTFFACKSLAETEKEYRFGEVAHISGKNYVIASNKQFVEILEITSDDKLIKISEVYGMERINDMVVNHEKEKTYLIILTGQYLIKYNITNPVAPKIELKRDLYKWKWGNYSVGYMRALASNNNYIFAAGSKGVRRFVKDSLVVDKIYTFNDSYNLAANNEILAVATKDNGLIFDIASGELKGEHRLENVEESKRKPTVDGFGNVYFPSDNSLIKIGNDSTRQYFNPTRPGTIFSYAVRAMSTEEIFYVNGYGITKLNSFLEKEKFFYSAPSIYGFNAWAVGIDTAEINNRKRIVVFNKSSALWLDDQLNLLFQYKYTSLYSDAIFTDLKIISQKYRGIAGDSVELKLYGFWPNEDVQVIFGPNEYIIRVNNLGQEKIILTVPEMEAGRIYIKAEGVDSSLHYQVSFDIR